MLQPGLDIELLAVAPDSVSARPCPPQARFEIPGTSG